jgi:TRAP transporter TAXI family solute receptor
MLRTNTIRRWYGWAMLGVLLGSIAVWRWTDDELPDTIRIATGFRGGLYYECGQRLAEELMERTGRPVRVLETEGSRANRELLLAGEADLAVLQLGSVETAGIAALAPLYPEVVLIVSRPVARIRSIPELAGHTVSIGPTGSGMRSAALRMLDHYRVTIPPDRLRADYFGALASDPELDAAIVSTGLLNPDLMKLLADGKFNLVPVLDAEALAIRHPHLSAFTIPRGLYSEQPALPREAIPTVATTNFLAGTPTTSPALVHAALSALYENHLLASIPGLMSKPQAASWAPLARHPEAVAYYDPYEGIGLLASLMETVAAAKELLFAAGAGVYLLWSWWRDLSRREQRLQSRQQKERLDRFLQETVEVERAQMVATEATALREYLDEITRIKLCAIGELTLEDLRADNQFSIFLQQCSAVSRKIEAKLEAVASGHPWEPTRVRSIDTATRSEKRPGVR